jgi:hypothetical protein
LEASSLEELQKEAKEEQQKNDLYCEWCASTAFAKL